MESSLQTIQVNIIEGNRSATEAAVNQALREGIAPERILKEGLIMAMEEVGTRFENGDFYVPEMLIAARSMQSGLAVLKPSLVEGGVEPIGKVVIGTVKGDLHDIGKNLVAMMLEGAGFEIIDLGTDVAPEKFIEAVKEHKAKIVGMSALLTTTMSNMKVAINSFKEAGMRDSVKVIVGGAPVTEAFAREIGADGFAADASRAVTFAKSLV
jgi:5-methyltetrahydrofolate--homocysteine methyltransferase